MFDFIKDEKIIDLASKEEWGDFACEIQRTARSTPSILAKLDMFEYKQSGFERGGRCTVSMKMPGLDWVGEQPAEGEFADFPNRTNGNKVAMPLYLKLILYSIEGLKMKGVEKEHEKCDFFVLAVNNKAVQVLLYGRDCTFPFLVNSN